MDDADAGLPGETASAGAEVELVASGAVAPASCACCGAYPAARAQREMRRHDGAELFVPYCVECHRHATAAATRTLAVTAASCLVGLTLAAGLPLAWGASSPVVYALLVIAGACLPLTLFLLHRPRRRPGHTAAGRAAWWTRSSLFCTSRAFGTLLASQNGVPARPASLREPRWSHWIAAGPALAALATPAFYLLFHPAVRVLNLTGDPVSIWVDGQLRAWVEPTSAESPAAGVELRVSSGTHQFSARTARGHALADGMAFVQSGAAHLYAPGSTGFCFWLDTTRYGREGQSSVVRPLPPDQQFWRLPSGIDTWFSPNPPASSDERSTGGALTALRQAPCAEAPPSFSGAGLDVPDG